MHRIANLDSLYSRMAGWQSFTYRQIASGKAPRNTVLFGGYAKIPTFQKKLF